MFPQQTRLYVVFAKVGMTKSNRLDHSNPLSRPYSERLNESGFVHCVPMRMSIEPFTLDDVHFWLSDHGQRVKVDYILSNWSVYFKDRTIAILFALKWS